MISETVAASRAGRAVASRHRHAGTWATRFPAINGSALHVVRRGTPWLVPEHGGPVPLRAGSIVFLPHGPAHGLSSEPRSFRSLPARREPSPSPDVFDVDVDSCCYHLDRGRVPSSMRELPQVVTVAMEDGRYPALRALADLLGEHAADARPGHDVALPAVVDLLLVHLLRVWHDRHGDAPPAGDPRIARVLRLVHSEPHRAWTVQQLSDAAGMSRAAFTRGFAEAVNEPPGAYLQRRRLDRGARLLRQTSLPLSSIARQLGYATEYSFSAAFRRTFDIAPGAFRRRER